MSDIYVLSGRPRCDAQNNTNDHVFRIDIFNAALDKLLVEIDFRFNAESLAMLHLTACTPWRNEFAAFDIAKLVQLAKEFYPVDFADIELLIF